jgi:hypothetical protein
MATVFKLCHLERAQLWLDRRSFVRAGVILKADYD